MRLGNFAKKLENHTTNQYNSISIFMVTLQRKIYFVMALNIQLKTLITLKQERWQNWYRKFNRCSITKIQFSQ